MSEKRICGSCRFIVVTEDELTCTVNPENAKIIEDIKSRACESFHYKTPLGVDERVIPYPSMYTEEQVNEFKRRGIKFINWSDYAMASGPGFDTGFFDDIVQLRKERRSVIILITGKAGVGKTWGGLRLCEIFDSDFKVPIQVCFTIEHLLKIFSNEEGYVVERGQCILIDESQYVAGARNWYEELQKLLMQHMAAIRSRGYIIVIIALHRSTLDKVIRKHLLTYQLHVEDRGIITEYSIYLPRFEEHERQSRQGQIILPVPGDRWCSSPDCLVCDDKGWCTNMRAVYERNKDKFLESSASRAMKRAEDKQKREDILTNDDYVQMVIEEGGEGGKNIAWNNQDNIEIYWILDILERRGHRLSDRKARRVAKTILRDHPELKPVETEPGRKGS